MSCFPRITQGLLDRGYSEEAVKRILGGNLLRAFREVEHVAAAEQKVREPSLKLLITP